MPLQCNEEKLARLPIDDRYKKAAMLFCSNPENESACQLLCDAPDEVIIQKIKEIEQTVGDWAINGPPPELVAQAEAADPKTTAILAEGLQKVRPEAESRMRDANSFANGGLATLGRFGDNNLSHTAKGEVVVPNNVFADNPGLREGLGSVMKQSGADPARYTVGGPKASINPNTGMQEFFSLGGLIGGVVGFAVCGPACAALGAGGGTFIETGDVKESLLMAAGGYAIGTMAAGAGLGAAGAAPVVDLSAAAVTPEMVSTYAAENMIGIEAAAAELGASATTAAQAAALDVAALTPYARTAATAGQDALLSKAASMGGQQAANQMIPAATEKAIKQGTPSFTEYIKGFADKPILTAEQSGLPFNITGKEAIGGIAALGSMAATPEPAQTSPWSSHEIAYAQQIASKPMIDIQAHQQGLKDFRPISTSGMVGYNVPSYTSQSPMQLTTGRNHVLPTPPAFANGGIVESNYQNGGSVNGPGTSRSDSIPARLSDGEFVMTADAVRGMGGGSIRDGARKMYMLMDNLERRNG